jgi:CBS domain-containing protein
MDEIDTFLAAHPPFDALTPEELAPVAAAVETRSYRVGEDALVEDGPPSSYLFVVRRGSMELLHAHEVIDVLEPGECFGHPSLLTGMAPAFTVRAHEDSVCCLVPREQALDVLGRRSGAGFVAATLRERLTRTGHTVHGLPEVMTTPVSALVARPPTFCDAQTPIREAARALTDAHDTAILVRLPSGIGIVTDADLRAKAATGDVPLDAPVSAVARAPVLTTPPEQLAVEATIDMLSAGADHLAVVDAHERVLGVVSASDLMGLDVRSPFALRHTILNATDEDAVVEAASHLAQVFRLLLNAGLAAGDLGRVLTLQHDAITARLIDLAIWRHGPAPVPWAWLVLGSAARREFTLGSDQDNALAYADSADEAAVDGYFARLAADVNTGLTRCGFGADNNDVLATSRLWRMSESQWLRTFDEVFEWPDRSRMIRAAVSFDFRHTSGGLQIVQPLVQRLQEARSHREFLRVLARTATDFEPPLGFRRSIVLGREGEAQGKVDLKRGGVIPIVNLARFHALAHGITISPTLDRLTATEEVGGLDAGTAQALREAFGLICRVRFDHHADCIEAGVPPDNLIDPRKMPPIARADLREAFRTIARAQKRLSAFVPSGL